MEAKEIEIDCPCCASRLTIDVLTRTVLRAVARQQLDETGKARLDVGRWSSAAERVQERPGVAQEKLEELLSLERDKEERLDDLFDKAKKKLRRRDDEGDAL